MEWTGAALYLIEFINVRNMLMQKGCTVGYSGSFDGGSWFETTLGTHGIQEGDSAARSALVEREAGFCLRAGLWGASTETDVILFLCRSVHGTGLVPSLGYERGKLLSFRASC